MEYERDTRRADMTGNIRVGKKNRDTIKHVKMFTRGTQRGNVKSHRDSKKSRSLQIKQETQEMSTVRN